MVVTTELLAQSGRQMTGGFLHVSVFRQACGKAEGKRIDIDPSRFHGLKWCRTPRFAAVSKNAVHEHQKHAGSKSFAVAISAMNPAVLIVLLLPKGRRFSVSFWEEHAHDYDSYHSRRVCGARGQPFWDLNKSVWW